MKARHIAMKLMENPEFEVVIIEAKKFEDDIPFQRIIEIETDSYEDNEGENHDAILLIAEPNPETIVVAKKDGIPLIYISEPKNSGDMVNNASFQISNIEGFLSIHDYESALIKANCLVSQLQAIITYKQ